MSLSPVAAAIIVIGAKSINAAGNGTRSLTFHLPSLIIGAAVAAATQAWMMLREDKIGRSIGQSVGRSVDYGLSVSWLGGWAAQVHCFVQNDLRMEGGRGITMICVSLL